MQRERRTRVREDDSEHDVTGEAPEGLAFELARAIEEADARRVISQLETHVKTREGVTFRDDGVDIGDVEAASAAGGYRESATLPLHRALGPRRTARLLVDLLVRSTHRRNEDLVTAVMGPWLGTDRERFDPVHAEAVAHAPEILPLLGRIAPDVVRFTHAELRQLARAQADDVIAALPRLALGLPSLDSKTRRAADQLLHTLAPRHEPGVPAALLALLRAGARHDRSFEDESVLGRAMEAGALENVRVLESAGARMARTRSKKARRRGEASGKEAERRQAQERARREAEARTRAARAHGTPTRAVERAREAATKTSVWNERVGSRRALRMIAMLSGIGALVAAFFVWQPQLIAPAIGLGAVLLAALARGGRVGRWTKMFRR